MTMPEIIAGLTAALVAGLLAYGFSEAAVRSGVVLDPVSERSNHSRPVPRLGGAAVLMGLGGAATVLGVAELLSWKGGQLFLLAGLAGCLGLADDLFGLRPSVKFAGLVVIAVPAVVFAGAVQEMPLPFIGWVSLAPLIGYAMSAFWLLSIANVVNFMDGLNGLAGCFVAVALAAAGLLIGGLSFELLAVQAAILGFLLANIFSGRIFLGDGGSMALGMALGTAPLLASEGGKGFWLVPLVALPLILDVALTLIRRASRGARLAEPHREHVYQRVKAAGWSHQASSAAVLSAGLGAVLIGWFFWDAAQLRPLAYWASAVVIAFLWATLMMLMLAAKRSPDRF
jgi:UDP-N-acetylmuramyl pentapeptide phosphotransferase/UDP-N-acetylglucosamine-1-phosphate transferase